MQPIRHPECFRAWAWLLIFIVFTSMVVAAPPSKDLSFLENRWIKLGVRTNAGACVAYFSPSSSNQNVINDYDLGRFIQQSYYGRPDGSKWADKPWKWNPVQGGSHNGKPSRLLAFNNDGKTIHAKTTPRHWATGADTPNVVMEEWITLQKQVVRIHYKMSYLGTEDHPAEQQELPAVFLNPGYNTLTYYNGKVPWQRLPLTRRHPSPTNEHDAITENWAAYVNQRDWGMGIYVPGVTNMTFYYVATKPGPQKSNGCAYLAPIQTIAIRPGTTIEYDVYLRLGSVQEIRNAFSELHEQGKLPKHSGRN